MGLLDDAIREHLELKRRRGADPEEVERLEREALGPVRRAPDAADSMPEGSPLAYERGTAAVEEYERDRPENGWEHHEPAAPAADEPWAAETEDSGYGAPETHAGPPAYSEPPRFDDPDATQAFDAHDLLPPAEAQPPVPPDPPPPAAAQPPPAAPPAHEEPAHEEQLVESGGETVEYDVEGEHAAAAEEGAPEGEDVLEETPEFLQDTPDHDRLWFEQRPPKDFDFDG